MLAYLRHVPGDVMPKLRVALLLVLILAGAWWNAPASAQAPACRFVLGFAALRDLVGREKVGDCLEDEHFNVENGNAEQRTTGGLLVWRKIDNFAAFTDGGTTWVNGPNGLQSRPNTERFAWERDPRPPVAGAPQPPSPGRNFQVGPPVRSGLAPPPAPPRPQPVAPVVAQPPPPPPAPEPVTAPAPWVHAPLPVPSHPLNVASGDDNDNDGDDNDNRDDIFSADDNDNFDDEPATGSCCRRCSTGKPCGNTCIARNRTCRAGPGCACSLNGEPSLDLAPIAMSPDEIIEEARIMAELNADAVPCDAPGGDMLASVPGP